MLEYDKVCANMKGETMAQQNEVPLISREILFGNPDKTQVRISHDGRYVSWLAPLAGVLNVWIAPANALDKVKPVTNDTGRGIRYYIWAYDNTHILYIQDKNGDENWHIYSVVVDTVEVKDLTPIVGVQARIQAVSHKFPDEVLIGLNDRDPRWHDIHRLNIQTGDCALVLQNDTFSGFVIDDAYALRFAMHTTSDGGREYLKPDGAGGWASFIKVAMEDSMSFGIIGFNKTGEIAYLVDSRERNTAALFTLNLETGKQMLVAEDPKSDVQSVLVHPTEKHIQGVAFNYERVHWQIVDNAIAEDWASLRAVSAGDMWIASRTLADTVWIVAYVVSDGPTRFYRYDRATRRAEFLFTDRQELESMPLQKMIPAVIKSRDDLSLVSYYTLPPATDSSGNGIPDTPLPMVLWVHGGPWGRDSWGYDAYHQWFANRGYAVLSVNYRASWGFGKDFLNAGNREWAGKIHDDLIDAVTWAVAAGIADPERVAIGGISYGGYSTLVGLTFTPEVFACGVDVVGPSNLVTLLETMPDYWKPDLEMFMKRVGDYRTEEGRTFLASCSPLTYAGRICRPLLIGQGANDPRVKQAEADQIVQAMQANNIPVTYVLYADEGHGFARPENRRSFNAIAEAFLGECLGGRVQPIGTDFEGASLSVPVGAEHVPGLSAALPR
ncbi:MAG: S9 family peptidase [Anaerolineae bacterium]|nr:S9 family peptidase [Anaerolineae bacterium]